MRFERLLPTSLRVLALQAGNSVATLRGVLESPRRAVSTRRHSDDELRVLREKAAEQRRQMMASMRGQQAHEWALRVIDVVPETDDATTIVFERPDDIRMNFIAGQFLTFMISSNQETFRRSYSISSSPNDKSSISITVKRVDGGAVSPLLQSTKVGDILRAVGPNGRFGLAAVTTTRRVVLIGAGSGLTPLWSIAQSLAESRPEIEVAMVCGARSANDRIFGKPIDALARSGGRISARWALSRQKKRGAHHGRITAASLGDLVTIDNASEYFVCGPDGMIAEVTSALRGAGVGDAQIHVEHFTLRSAPTRTSSQRWSVSLARSGRLIDAAQNETLLDAALKAGVPMPYSCAMGGCAACKCRVIEGAVEMDEPNCLTREERDRGEVLACVARVCGPVVIDA